MKARSLTYLFLAIVSGCSIPQVQDLRAMPPNERFIIQAPLACLYDRGVEHVSSYIGMNEPRFTWYTDSKNQYAWFRQPLTLVELEKKSNLTTEVRRSQTSSASSFGQANELIEFLKANPCPVH